MPGYYCRCELEAETCILALIWFSVSVRENFHNAVDELNHKNTQENFCILPAELYAHFLASLWILPKCVCVCVSVTSTASRRRQYTYTQTFCHKHSIFTACHFSPIAQLRPDCREWQNTSQHDTVFIFLCASVGCCACCCPCVCDHVKRIQLLIHAACGAADTESAF